MIEPGRQSEGESGISRSLQWKIFFACWLVYLVHFSPFVTREIYLTMAIAERGTFQVPEYMGLHSDLFAFPGRGDFVGTNPGMSFLAVPVYWAALPVVNVVAPVRPRPAEPKSEIQYKDQRRNNWLFYQRARARGIEVRLGVAALLTSGFFMAPLTALGAVLMFRLFRRIALSESSAVCMTMVFALGTPIFLRAGTLSLNLTVALLSFLAFALIGWSSEAKPDNERWRYFSAGALGGYAVATDFTGVVALFAIGFFALIQQLRNKSFGAAVQGTLWTVAGSIGPGLFLLWYQWHCYGNALLPVQFHMPKTVFAGYPSEHGFGWPLPAALWGLLFDPQYGLLVFSPLFALALYHPVLLWKKQGRVPARFAVAAWVHFAALWVFCSCVHYTIRHQWQDGVRYMVPALPPLFLLVGDVLARLPRWVTFPLLGFSFFSSWCVAMVRSSPLDSMARVLAQGVQFPWLTTLSNAAMQYFPPLADPASAWSQVLPWAVLAATVAGLTVIWQWPVRKSTSSPAGV